jgi:hypothetical protein
MKRLIAALTVAAALLAAPAAGTAHQERTAQQHPVYVAQTGGWCN